jgi:Short C-terminal domain
MKNNERSTMHRIPRGLAIALSCCALLSALPAHAGLMDKLFGQNNSQADAPKAAAGQRLWAIREFTQIELVGREPGAPENQQPIQLPTEALRQQLAQIEFNGPSGRLPLFTADEIGDLVTPLVQALAAAGPGDDLLLLSSYRREGGILGAPKAVTARLFVQGGSLQMIVHDARYDFYDLFRGTHVQPKFSYGSRGTPGTASLQSPGATNRRPDWIAIPLQGAATPATAAAPMQAMPMQAAPAPAAPLQVAPVTAPTPRKPMDAAGADDIERRLETLKRLRDKNLITEDEYQQKRREILQLL